MTSPFEKYRHLLLDEDYSTANSLQQFTLSLYNSDSAQFRASKLTNYDAQHFAIFVELATWYHRHGENDPDFMQVCREMWAQRKQIGRDHLARVIEHEAIAPGDYEDGSEADWHAQKRWLDERTKGLEALGWISLDGH